MRRTLSCWELRKALHLLYIDWRIYFLGLPWEWDRIKAIYFLIELNICIISIRIDFSLNCAVCNWEC